MDNSKTYSGPMRFAHRGLVQYAPENTVGAFQAAVDHGCEGIELDIRVSKDGVAIVVHDDHMTRMTDGKLTTAIHEMTAQEICAVELPYAGHLLPFHPPVPYSEGEGSARSYTPEQMEYFRACDTRTTHLFTFADFDRWFAGIERDILVEVELCAPGSFRAVYPVLKQSPNCGRYIVFSGHRDILEEMRETLAQNGVPEGLRLGANFRRLDAETLELIRGFGFYEVGLNDKWFTEDDVKLLDEMGVKVFSNLGDYPEWWTALQTIGAVAFKTNYAEAYTQWYYNGKIIVQIE